MNGTNYQFGNQTNGVIGQFRPYNLHEEEYNVLGSATVYSIPASLLYLRGARLYGRLAHSCPLRLTISFAFCAASNNLLKRSDRSLDCGLSNVSYHDYWLILHN